MLRAKIAERLLALFTARGRAAAIVGDLLELHGGRAAFGLAVVRTTCELSWRFGLGFVVAAAAEFCCLVYVGNWAARPPHGMDRVAAFSAWCCALLTACALFALIRFGVFDGIGKLAVALALLIGLDLLFWWAPYVRPASGAMAALVILLACRTRPGRHALLRLLLAMVAAAAPLLALFYWFAMATAERCRSGCTLDLHNAPVLVLVPISFLISSGLVAGTLEGHRDQRAQLS
jgi:hypothetical protein